MHGNAGAEEGGATYIIKVSTKTLCSLTLRSLANSESLVKSKATVDAHRVCKKDKLRSTVSVNCR